MKCGYHENINMNIQPIFLKSKTIDVLVTLFAVFYVSTSNQHPSLSVSFFCQAQPQLQDKLSLKAVLALLSIN